jgi:hypothetical protein
MIAPKSITAPRPPAAVAGRGSALSTFSAQRKVITAPQALTSTVVNVSGSARTPPDQMVRVTPNGLSITEVR